MRASSRPPAPLSVDGVWFAAGSARRRDGILTLGAGEVRVESGALVSVFARAAVRCSGFGEPFTIELPDGGAFVVAGGQEAAAAVADGLASEGRAVRRWERSLPAVALSLAGAVGLVALLVLVVLPAAVRPAAFLVPDGWARVIDDQVLLVLEDRVLGPSGLPVDRQASIEKDLRALVAGLGLEPAGYRVLVRSGEGTGPNAFALPGGTLIVTDELVALAADDDELLAVLAHEVGHVEGRHGLQQILRGSALAVALVLIGPDPGAIASLASGLPAVFLENGYSRDFEREADDFACGALARRGLGTGPLADVLGRLAAEHPEADGIPTWISTHPDTPSRIAAIRAWK